MYNYYIIAELRGNTQNKSKCLKRILVHYMRKILMPLILNLS